MNYKKGSNQYRIKHKYILAVKPETWASVWFVAFVTMVSIPLVQPHITSPCPPDGCFVKTVMAYEQKSKLREVIDYIVYKFEDEGKVVVNQALQIAFCESKWNTEAYNYNSQSDLSSDFKVFQINSVHVSRYGTDFMYDWKANVDTAYKIYKQSGWGPWVCAHKLGII